VCGSAIRLDGRHSRRRTGRADELGIQRLAKYENYKKDAEIGAEIERITGIPRIVPRRPDNGERLFLEGAGSM